MKPLFGFARLGGLAVASLCLGACIFGGTGSDHENGIVGVGNPDFTLKISGVTARVVDAEGRPIRNVTLNLFDPAFRPDAGLVRANLFTDTAKPAVTDSLGIARLDLRSAGKFVVEGVAGGQTLFYDTLAAPNIEVATPFTFRARATAAFKGKVKLVSGMRVDSGWVFIRGTSRAARLDAAGNYNLGILPADVARMGLGLRYVSSPTSVQESKEVVPDTGKIGPVTTAPAYDCKDVPMDSAARIVKSQPAQSTQVSADSLPAAKVQPDTAKVKPALKACDSLPLGGVINVVSRDTTGNQGAKRDSTAVPVLVLSNEKTISSFNGTKVVPATVISYADCVLGAGRETTSFALQVQISGANSDLLIGDVAAKCLEK
jgi:hypothetical protein